MGFNHSIKVPTQYKKAAKVLKKCTEEDVSVKNMIYNQKHADVNKLYALISKICQNRVQLNDIIDRSEILKLEGRMDPYMCRILVAELLIGVGQLNGNSKPCETVRKYEPRLRELYEEVMGSASGAEAVKAKIVIPRYVRINTLKMKRPEFLERMNLEAWKLIEQPQSYKLYLEVISNLEDDQFVEDFHVENLFAFPCSSKRYWAMHELVKSTSVLLQDKSSCLAPIILSPPKRSVVLDMCSAPGLKTTHLAALLKNKGRIYAVEKHRMRFETMRSFAESSMGTCIQPMEADVLKVTDEDVPNVEYILLDPSCSGSGIVHRLDDSKYDSEETNEERLDKLSRLQLKMLLHAMQSFPQVKRIVYSTCSINAEENEQVVQKALKQCKQFKLISPLAKLKDDWNNFGSNSFKKIGRKCIYCRPDQDQTNGFFIALIERKDEACVAEDTQMEGIE